MDSGTEGRTAQLALSPHIDLAAQTHAHQEIADGLAAGDRDRAAAFSGAHRRVTETEMRYRVTARSPPPARSGTVFYNL